MHPSHPDRAPRPRPVDASEVTAMAHPVAHASTSRRAGHSLARKSLCGSWRCSPSRGCSPAASMIVMDPAGDVAVQQRNLIIASTALMLLVILPVIALTFLFAWRYRASNTEATYDPDFHHSTQLEVVIWTVPLLIIIALGAMTWISTHTLDPFRPFPGSRPNRPVPADVKPLDGRGGRARLEVALHLPRIRVASVNEMAAPVNSADLLQDHLVLGVEHLLRPGPRRHDLRHAGHGDEAPCRHEQAGRLHGTCRGITAEPGFSRMNFGFRSVIGARLRRVGGEGQGGRNTARSRGLSQARETERSRAGPVLRVAGERPLRRHPGHVRRAGPDVRAREMHHIDRMGGAAQGSEANRRRLDYDNRRVMERRRAIRRHRPGIGTAGPAESNRKG